MTSPVLQLPQVSAEFLGNLCHHSQPNRDDRLGLAVAIHAPGSEGQANNVVFVDFKLRDEIDVEGSGAVILDRDHVLWSSEFSDNGHFGSGSNDWRGHRLVIDEMNRRAEETR